nr:phage tail assembly chaperone [uncultured Brevundimonas sp.]
MTIFYSPSTGAFYDNSFWDAPMPADVAEVTAERHAELLEATTRAQIIQAGPDGEPVASDAPAPPAEAVAIVVRRRRDAEIARLRWFVERHRDEITLGVTTTLTAEDFILVLQHIQLLRDLPDQAGFPADVEWPTLAPELFANAA